MFGGAAPPYGQDWGATARTLGVSPAYLQQVGLWAMGCVRTTRACQHSHTRAYDLGQGCLHGSRSGRMIKCTNNAWRPHGNCWSRYVTVVKSV